MDYYRWLPQYVYNKYGYEITFDQTNLSPNSSIENFITRMVIPDLRAYLLIEPEDSKEIIKDNIRKLFSALNRNHDECPICFNGINELNVIVCETCLNIICVDCLLNITFCNKGQAVCPFCRSITGEPQNNYNEIIRNSISLYVQD